MWFCGSVAMWLCGQFDIILKRILETFWAYLWIMLESFCDHFAIIWFFGGDHIWDNFGFGSLLIVLRSFWDHPGIICWVIVGSLWDHFQIILAQPITNLDSILQGWVRNEPNASHSEIIVVLADYAAFTHPRACHLHTSPNMSAFRFRLSTRHPIPKCFTNDQNVFMELY